MVEAVKWYRKAAEQGVTLAESNLGYCYANGAGVESNIVEAIKWYRKAADQGNSLAQFNLATCFFNGQGVSQDYAEAVKLFRKAADQGNPAAQINLASCFFNGAGVTQDYAEGVKWYRKAAQQGDAIAQGTLGFCYYKGEGTPQNYMEAYKWLNLSAAQGNADAAKMRDIVSGYMTQSQIAEGQRLAAAFIPGKDIQQNQDTTSSNSNSLDNPKAAATGFFITDDGYLISNYHVVKDATKVRLVTSAGTVDAKVVQVDAANDLALLKAVGKFSPLPIAASRSAHLGGTVATIGFPDPSLQGFSPKLAKGEIASLSGAGDDPRYFQISVPVQPGNSGGALVDERGNVIGIVSAKLDAAVALAASGALPENVNYAVKSSLLLSFLESVPEVSDKLKTPNTTDEKFSDVVKSAQDAAVLVLVY
jgi:TPR repeat protein